MNEVIREHGVLVRHWAHLQQTITETARENGRTVAALETEVIRLRGQLLVARTQLFWGISGAPPVALTRQHRASASSSPAPSSWPQVDAVLCRTGCAGHAHPWRDDEGLCIRSGEPCGPVEPERSSSIGSPRPAVRAM